MNVAVVGAGAAGLMAALTLVENGHRVTVFERSERVGGRIWTKKEQGRWFDPGGEWIDADHPLLLGLAHRFHLEIEDAPSGARRWHADGLMEEADFDDAEARFEASVATNADFAGTLAEFLAGLDRLTDAEKRWIYVNLRSDEGEELSAIDYQGWRAAFLPYLDRVGSELSAYRLKAGMGALIEAMNDALPEGTVVHQCVAELRNEREMVRVDSARFDAAVVAIPATDVPKLNFVPALPEGQRAAWAATVMSRTVKVCLHFRTRWWESCGWNGSGLFDSGVQQTWLGTRSDGAPTLIAYINGDRAAALHCASEEAVAMTLNDLARWYPMAADYFIDGELIDWIELAGGGFSIRPPGFYQVHLPELRKPHGRICFAGEHLGNWYGFIEGALESGLAAAAQVENWR